MAPKSLIGRILVAIGALCLFVAFTPLHAQGGKAQEEEFKKAAMSARAAEQAKELAKAPKAATPSATVPVDPANVWVLTLSNGGTVRIQLRPDVAPAHVERIKLLTSRGFYNGLKFHRVIEGFMAQGGDPKNDGSGGSTEPDLKAEFNDLPHVRGVVSMARAADENSANSQFFIMFLPRLQLDHKYTVFGRVIEGMPYVDAIERGEPPANPTSIVTARMEAATPAS
ncbi:peptidylprolyl isomerase [Sphingobium subterraneum]|uniref:Peptidyl-prolyl cis-trans isomerase n=1 Tax=Sphingobium subterraneum TaxID=627688 RepID=A0A841J9K3_9SPHN|nr:peptidylprolyl isomerase [Sphingobium subterraneum]